MKKLSIMLLSLILLLVFTGCSSNEEQNATENKDTESTKTKTNTNTTQTVTNEPTEPTHEDLCYFCNMKIYTKNEELGSSTAQAIKEDGTHVFFDDSGCLLNAARKYEEEYTKEWVRDYTTSEWIEADKAVVVKADVATPMKYGYLFFIDEESANNYIEENKTNGVITDWTAIDTESEKRYKAKMEKMKMESEEMDMDSKENMDDDTNI